MGFKFDVGQVVEYKPIGGVIGLYTVVRQMPEEFRAFDLRYRIKSNREGFERNVLECDLTEAANSELVHVDDLPPRRHGMRS
jgi:hypothetical protein